VRAHVYDSVAKGLIRKSFNEPRHRRMPLKGRLLEASGWRADATKLVRAGKLTAADQETIEVLLRRFLDGADRGVILNSRRKPYSASTLHRMRQAAEYRLVPKFGRKHPGDVVTPALRRYVELLLEEGLSPSSIANTMKPLSAMYRWAVDIGEVTTNPCAELRMPTGGTKRERIATPEEAARLLALLREDEIALWGLAFYAGLRRSEAIGSIDLAKRRIRVRRTYHVESHTLNEIRGKSDAAWRTLPMVGPLHTILKEHLFRSGRREGFLFGPDPERPWSGQWSPVLRRAYKRWDNAGASRIGFHECRHTYASWIIAASSRSGEYVDIKELSALMGHSTIQQTMDLYGHLMPDHLDRHERFLGTFLDGFGGAASA
jgi:integrase